MRPELQQRNIRIGLSNEQTIDYDIQEIISRVDQLKNFFIYGVGVFAFGLILQVIGFVFEMKGSGRK